MKLRQKDLLCLSYTDWFSSWSTPQQLMSRLAGDNRVLYVDQPRSFLYGLRRRNAKGEGQWEGARLKEVAPNLHVLHLPHVFLPLGSLPVPVAMALLRFNGWLMGHFIRRALRQLGMSQPVLWNFSVLHAGAVKHLTYSLNVYDIADVWELYVENPWGREFVRQVDAEMTRSAQLVFPSTPAIAESHKALNPRQVLISHGADYAHFSKARTAALEVPEDSAAIPRPIVGSIGVMDASRFDAEAILQLAQQRPDWSIVLVGPVLEGVDIARIQKCKNVYLTGSKPIAQLPNYLKAFDVALIPYRVTELTNSLFPLKLMEYLSGGKPVVSAPLANVLPFKELVYLVSSQGDYASCVEKALAEEDDARRDARQQCAREFSWDAIVRKKAEALAEALEEMRISGRKP